MKTRIKILTRMRLKKRTGFDYIRRSTADAIDKMGTCKDSMLEQNTQKNEMEISIENCDITE